MIRAILTLGFLAFGLALSSASHATAAYGAHGCFAANMEKVFSLDWDRSYITNTSTSQDVWVFCPVATTPLGPIYKNIIVRFSNNNSSEQDFTCHLREVDLFGVVTRTRTQNRTVDAGFSWGVSWTDMTLEDNFSSVYTLACRLPPLGSLGTILIGEADFPI